MTSTTTRPTGRKHARYGPGSADRRRLSDLPGLVGIFAILTVIAFPVVWMFYSSVRPTRALAAGLSWDSLFTDLSFDSYRRLFESTGFDRYLVNSLIICLIGTLITVLIASLAGFALSRYTFAAKKMVMLLLVATQLLPFVVLITPVYLFFSRLGLLNSYHGMVIVYVAMTLPLAVLLMYSFMRSVPTTLDEAARVDGASTLTVIARVVLPLAWPGIVTVAVTSFIAMWEEFLFAQVFLTGSSVRTVQVGLAGLFGEYSTDWGVVMAASVMAALPTILLFAVVQRRLVAGVAAGALKE